MKTKRSKDSSSDERDKKLNEVLAAYLEAVEAGRPIDQQEWLRRYPDLANELAEFFANRQQLAPLHEPDPTMTWDVQSKAVGDGARAKKQRSNSTEKFGAYEILEEIARGGMGVVYKARQVKLNRIVALKMILAGELAGVNATRRFLTEAEAASGLDHPNIVPVYDSGEIEDNHYFTMKLIEGGNLADWFDECRLPQTQLSLSMQKDIAQMLATVARAVHHAHERGVLHRDLKPANILLQKKEKETDNGSVLLAEFIPMVTDFGLAKRVRDDGGISQSQNIVGTAYYMSPEQALAKAASLTVATDIYSLGTILYEMLAGQLPFQGETYLDTLLKVVHEPAVPPRQINPQIDSDLQLICLKCMAKAPDDRYASAAVLAQDLENWVVGEPVSVRPLGRLERAWRWCRRKPAVALLLFLVALLLVGGGVYSTIMAVLLSIATDDLQVAHDAAEHHAHQAEANAVKAEANAAAAARNAKLEAEARMTADKALEKTNIALKREQLALLEEKIQREKNRQLLVRQYAQSGVALLDQGDPLGALAWFGEALGLEQGDPLREKPHRVGLAVALRRAPHILHAVFHKSAPTFCFSADGRRLFTAEWKGQANLWDATTDKTVALRFPDNAPIRCAVFNPESSLLATGHDDGQVRLWDVDGKSVGQSIRHPAAVMQLEFTSDGKHLLSVSKDGTARISDKVGKSQAEPIKHDVEGIFAALSRDGRFLATTGNLPKSGSEARIWDLATGKQVPVKPLYHQRVNLKATFSSDGNRLFSSSNIHNLRVWDLTTGKAIAKLSAIPGISNGMWFSPDRQHAIFANGTTAQVHELQEGKPVGRVMMHGGDVILAAFGNDGKQVVTVGRDRVVRVWDTLSGQSLTPALRHPSRVSGVALDRSGQRLVTSCDDGTVRLWDLRSRDQAAPPLPVKSDGEILAVAPGGKTVLTLGKQGAKIYDVASGTARTGALSVSKLSRALFSPDGKRLATLDAESLRLWDLSGKQPTSCVLVPSSKVQHVTFSPDGSCVVARLTSEEIRVWDSGMGKDVLNAKYPEIPPWDVPVVSPDGRRIVTLRPKVYAKAKLWDKDLVKVWDLAAGKVVLPGLKHSADVIQATYSPDGLRLATASADGTARVWDMKTGEPLTPPLTHTQFLHLIGFSLDGRLLVTAGSDGTARVWDPLTGQPLIPLLRQSDPITAVSFTPEGDRLATISKGGVIRLWDIRADGRPVADLVFLTKLLSGLQMHASSGSFVPFEVGNLRDQWRNLRSRYPAEFGREN